MSQGTSALLAMEQDSFKIRRADGGTASTAIQLESSPPKRKRGGGND